MNWPDLTERLRPSLRFASLFLLLLVVQAVLFEHWRAAFGLTYMLPVARAATLLLNGLGLDAALDTAAMPHGFCELVLRQVVYRVTFDCTGLFAMVVFLALALSYPTSAARKGKGLLLGVPAIFAFSTLRLVCLGIVAAVNPDWIEIFHVYVMELATVGFMLYVLKYWINRVVYAP